MGMSARDLARIAYCMLRGGRWNDRQIIPKWFIDETVKPSHDVTTPELRWKLNSQVFSSGWELPARHLVIDHSVMVDEFGNPKAFGKNVELEYHRNGERYEFLKWGSRAFDNFQVVPPGTGICHQVNLEY